MSQNDFVIANADGATVRADLNGALQALATLSSGTTAPTTTYAGMLWWDTTANLIKQRNGANTAWITAWSFDGTTLIPYRAGTAIGPEAVLETEQATTSGTTKDFTGIPAGVKRITILLDGVSLNATDQLTVLLGDAGGFEATGYAGFVGAAGAWAGTAAEISNSVLASITQSGRIELVLMNESSNKWYISGQLVNSAGGFVNNGGTKSLSEVLTQVRLTSLTPSTFDAGNVNIQYGF